MTTLQYVRTNPIKGCPISQGNHNLQICLLYKSVIWWEIVARSELQCLGQDESCGYGAVECVCGEMGYVAMMREMGTSGENCKNNVAASLILISR